jgi:hypothetical protein
MYNFHVQRLVQFYLKNRVFLIQTCAQQIVSSRAPARRDVMRPCAARRRTSASAPHAPPDAFLRPRRFEPRAVVGGGPPVRPRRRPYARRPMHHSTVEPPPSPRRHPEPARYKRPPHFSSLHDIPAAPVRRTAPPWPPTASRLLASPLGHRASERAP